jgi:hypothetical protein
MATEDKALAEAKKAATQAKADAERREKKAEQAAINSDAARLRAQQEEDERQARIQKAVFDATHDADGDPIPIVPAEVEVP